MSDTLRKASDFIDQKIMAHFEDDHNAAWLAFDFMGKHVKVGLRDMGDMPSRPRQIMGEHNMWEIHYTTADNLPGGAVGVSGVYDRKTGSYYFREEDEQMDQRLLSAAMQIMLQTMAMERGGVLEFWPQRIIKAEEEMNRLWPNGVHVHFEGKDTPDGRTMRITIENRLRCPYHDGEEPMLS